MRFDDDFYDEQKKLWDKKYDTPNPIEPLHNPLEQISCPSCGGSGQEMSRDLNMPGYMRCSSCGGRGTVERGYYR